MNIKLLATSGVLAVLAAGAIMFVYTTNKTDAVDSIAVVTTDQTGVTEQVQTSSRLVEETLAVSETSTTNLSTVSSTLVLSTSTALDSQSVNTESVILSSEEAVTESSFDSLIEQDPTGYGNPIGNVASTSPVLTIGNDILTGAAGGSTSVSTSY